MEKRAILQMTLDGVIIATYDSIEEASKKTSTCGSQISRCCRGYFKQSNGFKWAYDNSKFKLKQDPLDKLLYLDEEDDEEEIY